ncbi:hypothetical protein [Siphonobacter sp. SORGH_AS_0500]|uniref:hypothetical protein n=1 Tax=Siphonobacter sp. SORGH_AS_0500 TaxID=1864824 RepID=UPI00285B3A0E|nr:hypothetical protein [Siphonobacter sp. SORGH_AS_0500]MDR6196176.1 hypothetical protein [Siphonobacter sp. SORGH_AS_0500]
MDINSAETLKDEIKRLLPRYEDKVKVSKDFNSENAHCVRIISKQIVLTPKEWNEVCKLLLLSESIISLYRSGENAVLSIN